MGSVCLRTGVPGMEGRWKAVSARGDCSCMESKMRLKLVILLCMSAAAAHGQTFLDVLCSESMVPAGVRSADDFCGLRDGGNWQAIRNQLSKMIVANRKAGNPRVYYLNPKHFLGATEAISLRRPWMESTEAGGWDWEVSRSSGSIEGYTALRQSRSCETVIYNPSWSLERRFFAIRICEATVSAGMLLDEPQEYEARRAFPTLVLYFDFAGKWPIEFERVRPYRGDTWWYPRTGLEAVRFVESFLDCSRANEDWRRSVEVDGHFTVVEGQEGFFTKKCGQE